MPDSLYHRTPIGPIDYGHGRRPEQMGCGCLGNDAAIADATPASVDTNVTSKVSRIPEIIIVGLLFGLGITLYAAWKE